MNNPASKTNTIRDPRAVKIKRALLSVSDKGGLVEFAKKLSEHGVEIISTGGTAKAIKDAGIAVKDVSEHTGFPEMMDGRVKTLHPTVHGGILSRRDLPEHVKAQQDHNIGDIDLVVVNLYPFVETVAKGGDYDECIENIDIGGPAMIRSAAKNHEFVTIITDPQDYKLVLKDMENHEGSTTYATRQKLAANAYAMTATYDSNIASWFSTQLKKQQGEQDWPRRISFSGTLKQPLRYGENPHQQAALYMIDGSTRPGAAHATQVQGKELSYNNINDTDAAFETVAEFDQPAVAIIKHANPCGVAIGDNINQAYERALMCDPVSAFGGIIALNRTLTKSAAEQIINTFSEVIIAPDAEAGALDLLKEKKNIRVLTTGGMPDIHESRRMVTRVAGGLLVQTSDNGIITMDDLKVVSEREPTEEEFRDMLFAFKVAKHVKSNAIVYAKNGATVGIGAGQMNRLDSSRIAARKSMDAAEAAGLTEPLTKGSVVASDAFFPFADGLIAAAEAGVTAVIQPGGSIRDEEVIKAANDRGLAMVYTGMRHFWH
ncbi:MAG: bifunctional phosphoribosylaminoimidazolecarboxamide formyltransferase/IMP cyclohydrolase [Alphaproteobacteria bacterium]|nr:bifunctional phosphoribosylaminoimidazolecarboxamide formyltransferase/IMP cyclohydrolase [Alphaproteobacteria bacterium]NCQ87531.1 bifunctional phosphoribosylaminoimidazolecarboxamide formyltransferase/IMP cyclohydrolase [Alphaproteobacteria bacterium]NCT06399.1 bifunctional phosphoribosylaminoimidazolecarboxamide formyltransferase/IMP cyclohydrolase [Alphaproteobacteria bacterium]